MSQSILDSLDLENVPEQEVVPANEYELKVLKCDLEQNEKSGKWNVVWIFEILGQPNALNIFHYTAMPAPEDDTKKRDTKRRFAKEIFGAFGADFSNIGQVVANGDLIGAVAWALLDTETYEGREKNVIKRFIASK